VAEAAPDLPPEAIRQLHELLNSASELGADLHTLSHRLHSSTLESLGLVPGVSALCKEFQAQQGVQVEFTHNDFPRSVLPDVALCLFRIVKEGLRNTKKHSGASKARVRLELKADKVHVSVSDDGVGFNPRGQESKAGLGVRSMEERVRLLRGRFEIHSQPQKGSRVDAWVPLQSAES
jgi:signal transduction histidine kinase